MNSSPPTEPTHFRGKTLSPASPRPLHISEPQNIPVLQNQIDPHFNLMSTHMAQPPAPGPVSASDNAYQQYYSNAIPQDAAFDNTDIAGAADEHHQSIDGGLDPGGSLGHALADSSEKSEEYGGAHTLQNHMNQSDSEHPAVFGSLATFPAPAKNTSTPLPSDQSQNSSAFIQDTANTSGNPQDAFVTQSRNALSTGPGPDPLILPPNPESDVNGEGVNYQALLDNLSPTSATASPADKITSISTTASSRTPIPLSPSSLQTPIATFPIPAGLPARPPPQEKPAIHPNYTPGEDIRSYHKPPVPNTNASTSYNSQPNNTQRSSHGYIHNNGIAPNGLPPPPAATFQQPMPNANQPQSSPQTQQFHQTDNYGEIGVGSAAGSYRSEDQYPGKADIERSYDQFVQDEAIYVSEGTWDRFPQGSRLFVGKRCA